MAIIKGIVDNNGGVTNVHKHAHEAEMKPNPMEPTLTPQELKTTLACERLSSPSQTPSPSCLK